MIRFLRHFLGWTLSTFGSRKDLVLENLVWFLKTFRAKANVSAQHNKVEISTGLFVLPMIESLLATQQTQVV